MSQGTSKTAKTIQHTCNYCYANFARKDALKRHIETSKKCLNTRQKRSLATAVENQTAPAKKTKIFNKCHLCNSDVQDLETHNKSESHIQKVNETFDENVDIVSTTFKSRIATYKVSGTENYLTPEDFMNGLQNKVTDILKIKLSELRNIKVNLQLYGNYKKTMLEEEAQELKSFNTRNQLITYSSMRNLHSIYENFVCEIIARADEFQETGSGWTACNMSHLMLNVNKYATLRSGPPDVSTRVATQTNTILKGSPVPKWIQDKKACVYVANKDEASFAWALVSALHPVEQHRERVGKYPHYRHVLKLDDVTFPIGWEDIEKLENLNDVSINVYEIEQDAERISSPIYCTQKRRKTHVNLLLVQNESTTFFCWIRDMSALIGSQVSKHHSKKWFCDGCFLHFYKEEKLLEHCESECSKVRTILPTIHTNKLKFTNYRYKLRVPFVVYADFEAILHPMTLQDAKQKKNNKLSYTKIYQKHEPYSFGYYIKCAFDESLSKYVSYRQPNVDKSAAEQFVTSLERELSQHAAAFKKIVPMQRSEKTRESFKKSKKCHICHNSLTKTDRVEDHCHFTGVYRGAAHKSCNINYKIYPIIPIVFHNLSKYDAHFIIKQLREYKVDILAINKEKFISFTVTSPKLDLKLRFIDSCNFLASSLDELAGNLKNTQFHTINKHYPEKKKRNLLMRKGVFPYDYIDCFEKLAETKLPSQDCFYSSLNKSAITDEEYSHAQKVWDIFDIKTLGDYSDLYMQTDVLLLVDIFENFRDMCLKAYELDPAHYYTAPGLSWDAMLKYTKVELELFTDLSMVAFVKNGIRGGISQCSKKFAQANNKYLKDFNQAAPGSNYILYYDANNQYGWAMSKSLPLKDFRWLSPEEIKNLDIKKYSPDGCKGYFLEVDLKYPMHLHDTHNDLPLCAERIIPETSKSKMKKLITSLHDKHKYVIHYVSLQQALGLGLELTKIHRVMEFTQSQWLKPYIELNTNMRIKAKSSFEKNFYKLMNNAVFGKTVENVEKRVDVRLVSSWESYRTSLGARALISRPTFYSCANIGEDYVVIQMKRNYIKYDKPIFVGFSVLELSKTLMYDFHYNYILPKYKQKVNLLYTDTDSFIYDIVTDDFFADIKDDVTVRFDTSDYPVNNRFNLDVVNEKVVGMFKDECQGVMIKEFIGIRSKCYFILKDDDKDIKKIKGVKKSVVSKEVKREDFRKCLNDFTSIYREMNVIRSRDHTVYTQTQNKVALKNEDDKRFAIPDDSYRTLAWGHKDIEKYLLSQE